MNTPPTDRILALNGGSSSIKFAVFAPGTGTRLWAGTLERIGRPDAFLLTGQAGDGPQRAPIAANDPARAAEALIDWLEGRGGLEGVAAVGHRVVHGGPDNAGPKRVDADLIAALRRLVPLDPAHLPAEIALIETVARRFPGVPQVACFDTAFHHTLPPVARLLPVPRRFAASGVRRYGFHGLSYAYLLGELRRVAGDAEADGRVVLAHLGSGASLAAVRGGTCVETTMGFTPAGGLVMGTRTGDLDPGVLVHLMRSGSMTADQLDTLVTRESGLLGVSETSSDMRDLLAVEAADERAGDAVSLFCYQAKKFIGALAAVLGGLDTLVFAGGIGEHAPAVRARICTGLDFLGVRLDAARNDRGESIISADGAPARVRVIPTDEEAVIARAVRRVLDPVPSSPQQEPTP